MFENVNRPVFFSSIIGICFLTSLGIFWPTSTGEFFASLQHQVIHYFGWLYILGGAIFVIFLIFLMMSRFGDIKLGQDHIEPEYSFMSWMSMLYSAGIGCGLMFYGVAEPVMHFTSPPVGEPSSLDSAREAMKITFFHWGLHAWAIYAVTALTLAYFAYRHNLPLLPRSALYPLIGDKIYGIAGHIIDTFAVIGTMFGISTSLGLSAIQLNTGLEHLFSVSVSHTAQVMIIAMVTLVATISVAAGISKGIKRLSNINMVLAISLMFFILFLGPTITVLKSFVQNTGAYFSDLVHMTFNLYAYEKKEDWIGGWTLFYWSWWISWSPFVGVFIARISKGRTIREFLVAVLFAPTLFGFLWFSTFGNTAIDEILYHGAVQLHEVVNTNIPLSLFIFLEYFPWPYLVSVITLILMVTFFVSSSDSGSLVMDTLTSQTDKRSAKWQRIFWAVSIGLIASTLLLVGGLNAIQTMMMVSACPLVFMMLMFCYSLFQALKNDYLLQDNIQNHPTLQFAQVNVGWKEQLNSMTHYPKTNESKDFMKQVVLVAFQELAKAMEEQGLHSEVIENNINDIKIIVKKEGTENFTYGVRLREYTLPDYVDEDYQNYFRAEVFLHQGGQQYCVISYSKEQLIADVLNQYQRHMQFIYLTTSETADPSQ